MADEKAKTGLAVGALGMSTVALIAALTKKVEAAPEDEIVKEALAALLALIQDLQAKSDAIITALEVSGIEVEEAMPKNIREIRIQQNVPLNTGMILTQPPPFDGYIKEVKIHWPPGCNGLVDVRVGHGTMQFCPFEGFLSLDNVTPTYPFNEYVSHTENIFVEIQNTDGVNAHTISVMINIEEKV